jgi:hypothetical protein
MRTQIALMVFAMATVAAFGLFVSNLANAEQSPIGPVSLLSASSGSASPGFMLVKGGGGGMHHGGGGMHHGGNHHFNHGRYYGGYYPNYYGSGYYSSSPNCVWNGYKFVCYDSSSDFYDTY